MDVLEQRPRQEQPTEYGVVDDSFPLATHQLLFPVVFILHVADRVPAQDLLEGTLYLVIAAHSRYFAAGVLRFGHSQFRY